MKSWIIKALGVAVMAFGFMVGAQAQERGTKDEAKALADAAFEHVKKVGAEQAYKDFTTDKAHWTKKDLYVAVTDLDGNTLAHGANEKLIGKNMLGIKDANGVSFMAKMIETAKSPAGSGWVDYDWANPLSKKIEGKTSFVRMAPGNKTVVSVGYYR
jgi:signal transduction histidine kinase